MLRLDAERDILDRHEANLRRIEREGARYVVGAWLMTVVVGAMLLAWRETGSLWFWLISALNAWALWGNIGITFDHFATVRANREHIARLRAEIERRARETR